MPSAMGWRRPGSKAPSSYVAYVTRPTEAAAMTRAPLVPSGEHAAEQADTQVSKQRPEPECLWRVEHADFIATFNATIKTEGLPLDEWRSF